MEIWTFIFDWGHSEQYELFNYDKSLDMYTRHHCIRSSKIDWLIEWLWINIYCLYTMHSEQKYRVDSDLYQLNTLILVNLRAHRSNNTQGRCFFMTFCFYICKTRLRCMSGSTMMSDLISRSVHIVTSIYILNSNQGNQCYSGNPKNVI